MNITIRNLTPGSIKNLNPESELWEKELIFRQGTKTQITAPSASGKTTFLQMLYGLNLNFSGQILLGNKNIKELSIKEWAGIRQKTIAIVFQDLRLFDDFTGIDNIQAKADLTGTCADEEVKAMTARLGLEAAMSKKIKSMSLGEKQRIAILRTLVQPFSWLFLDEPFSHLDPENMQAARDLILEECAKRTAGVILTCLDGTALLPCDRVVKL